MITSKDVIKFRELITKAHLEQLLGMQSTLIDELRRRFYLKNEN